MRSSSHGQDGNNVPNLPAGDKRKKSEDPQEDHNSASNIRTSKLSQDGMGSKTAVEQTSAVETGDKNTVGTQDHGKEARDHDDKSSPTDAIKSNGSSSLNPKVSCGNAMSDGDSPLPQTQTPDTDQQAVTLHTGQKKQERNAGMDIDEATVQGGEGSLQSAGMSTTTMVDAKLPDSHTDNNTDAAGGEANAKQSEKEGDEKSRVTPRGKRGRQSSTKPTSDRKHNSHTQQRTNGKFVKSSKPSTPSSQPKAANSTREDSPSTSVTASASKASKQDAVSDGQETSERRYYPCWRCKVGKQGSERCRLRLKHSEFSPPYIKLVFCVCKLAIIVFFP